MNKIKFVSCLFILIFLCSCDGKVKVTTASVEIIPYDPDGNGKYWNVCIKLEKHSTYNSPYLFFEIRDKKGRNQEYIVPFYQMEKCQDYNTLVYFLHRHTPHEEWEWLRDLESDDIEILILKVKSDYNDPDFIYSKKII